MKSVEDLTISEKEEQRINEIRKKVSEGHNLVIGRRFDFKGVCPVLNFEDCPLLKKRKSKQKKKEI